MAQERMRRLLRVEGPDGVENENVMRRTVLAVDGVTELEFDLDDGWVDVVGDRTAVERAVEAIRRLGYEVR